MALGFINTNKLLKGITGRNGRWPLSNQAFGTVFTAAGSVQGDATALTTAARIAVVRGGDGTKGVILPAGPTNGQGWIIYNAGTGNLKVYPGSGDTIGDAAANVAVEIEPKRMMLLLAASASAWAKGNDAADVF